MVNNFININKTNNHISPQTIEHKQSLRQVGNPFTGSEKVQKCDEIKLINGIHGENHRPVASH
jgi:hypothetical protein